MALTGGINCCQVENEIRVYFIVIIKSHNSILKLYHCPKKKYISIIGNQISNHQIY